MHDLICAVAVTAVLVSAVAAAGAETGPIAGQADVSILKTLRQGHPRLIALDADIARIKQMIASHEPAKKWHRSLRGKAQRLLSKEPVKYELIGPRLLHVSRRALDRIYTLALMYRLDGEKRFADRAIAELLAVSAFKDWHPRHFLDTAEMTHAVAIGYDWLYDVLSRRQRATIRDAIVSKGLRPACVAYRKKTWWTRVSHNWNQVCNGGISIGALAVADEEPQTAAYVLNHAVKLIRNAMAEYAPDGGWGEGPGYWHYATSYNVFFLAALQSALGTDFGLSEMPGFASAGDFRLYSVGPIDLTFNYADAHEGGGSAPEMFWLARRFDKPIYAWHQRQHARGSAVDLLWFDPRGTGPRESRLPLDAYFRHVEVAFFRSAWEDRDAIFVGFKGGNNRFNHSHLDLGSFVLDALGQRWALDLGGDNYNLPAYFGKKRFTYYRLKTAGHNTLLINDENQDRNAAAPIIAYDSRPQRTFAIADLAAAYADSAKKVLRGVAMLDRKCVLIQDEIDAKEPVQVTWQMHTRAEIHLSGRSATLRLADAHLRARILEPADARFEIASANPPPPENPNKGVRKLVVRLAKQSGPIRLAVLLTPYRDEPAEPRVRVEPLSAWK